MERQPLLLQGLREAFVDDKDGPLPAILIALSVLAGVVDATSILRLGHVFVAAQTGNLVVIGLGLAGARGFSIALPALSLAGFVVGVLLCSQACKAAGDHRGKILRNAIAVKAVFGLIVLISVIITGDHFGSGVRDETIVMLAASMGSQLAAVRRLKVPDLMTVAFTMAMSGLLADHSADWRSPSVLRRAVGLLAFVGGVVMGGVLIDKVSVAAALGFGFAIVVASGVAIHLLSRSASSWCALR